MIATLDRIESPAVETEPQPASPLKTIVLQPSGSLEQHTCVAFQSELTTALQQAQQAVIVDFLWVSSTDATGIAVLAAGIQQAAQLGKALSFHAMDIRTRLALETEWNRQQERLLGSHQSWFSSELQNYLTQQTGA